MSLEQLSKTVDFVQDATPSNANDGETYLDTSQSPPQLKVFDSSANAFVRPRSIQNLDAPVSGAGATPTDIESGAEGAIEEDISNLTPASNSVAANLDGGVSAVDWSTKTYKNDRLVGNSTLNVNGSGYLMSMNPQYIANANRTSVTIKIDGNTVEDFFTILTNNAGDGVASGAIVLFRRFNTGFEITIENQSPTDVLINYVLD